MNRRQIPTRPADLEWDAEITKDAVSLGSGLCRIWTPQSFTERTIVEMEIRARVGPCPPPFTIRAERMFPDGATEYLLAENVWFTSIPQPDPRIRPRRSLTTTGTPELIVVGKRRGGPNVGGVVKATELTFHISDNTLLNESRIVEHHFRHGFASKPAHTHEIACDDGLCFRFERHFDYQTGTSDSSTEIRSFLAAVTSIEIDGDVRAAVDQSVLPALWDLLHLASFAARSTTRTYRWKAANECEHMHVYLGNVSPLRASEVEASVRDTLIDQTDFGEFMNAGLQVLRGSNCDRADLSRTAIVKATRQQGETAESQYMSLFSALESVLLHYRRHEKLEFTTQGRGWKKLRKAIEGCIDENASLFPSDDHRRAALRSVVALRRMPIGMVFERFAAAYRVGYADLWPVFDSSQGVSLANIRNRLAHGEVIDERRFDAFTIALYHLQRLVERCCLALLGWDWQKSDASEGRVQYYVGLRPIYARGGDGDIDGRGGGRLGAPQRWSPLGVRFAHLHFRTAGCVDGGAWQLGR